MLIATKEADNQYDPVGILIAFTGIWTRYLLADMINGSRGRLKITLVKLKLKGRILFAKLLILVCGSGGSVWFVISFF